MTRDLVLTHPPSHHHVQQVAADAGAVAGPVPALARSTARGGTGTYTVGVPITGSEDNTMAVISSREKMKWV